MTTPIVRRPVPTRVNCLAIQVRAPAPQISPLFFSNCPGLQLLPRDCLSQAGERAETAATKNAS